MKSDVLSLNVEIKHARHNRRDSYCFLVAWFFRVSRDDRIDSRRPGSWSDIACGAFHER
jgi:hypothetical protein